MLKEIGFFRELRHGDADGPSLAAARDGLNEPDVEALANYLGSAATLAATGSMVDDALDPAQRFVARLETATDGEWVWPRDLAYYVRTYHVALPDDFIARVRERKGTPPALSRDELIRVEEEYLS
ncbi:MAG TPA: hypothetical protein VF155_03045 [Candidatus Dormibacteraeota bacterium]